MTWQVSFKRDLRDQDNLWVFLSSWWRHMVCNLNTVFGVQLHLKKKIPCRKNPLLSDLGWAQDEVSELRLQVPAQLQTGLLFRCWNVSLISLSERWHVNQMISKIRRNTHFHAPKQQNFRVPFRVHSFQKTNSKPVGSSSYLATLVPLTTKAKMEMEIILLHQRANPPATRLYLP